MEIGWINTLFIALTIFVATIAHGLSGGRTYRRQSWWRCRDYRPAQDTLGYIYGIEQKMVAQKMKAVFPAFLGY